MAWQFDLSFESSRLAFIALFISSFVAFRPVSSPPKARHVLGKPTLCHSIQGNDQLRCSQLWPYINQSPKRCHIADWPPSHRLKAFVRPCLPAIPAKFLAKGNARERNKRVVISIPWNVSL